jgi:hypothetical protein
MDIANQIQTFLAYRAVVTFDSTREIILIKPLTISTDRTTDGPPKEMLQILMDRWVRLAPSNTFVGATQEPYLTCIRSVKVYKTV